MTNSGLLALPLGYLWDKIEDVLYFDSEDKRDLVEWEVPAEVQTALILLRERYTA